MKKLFLMVLTVYGITFTQDEKIISKPNVKILALRDADDKILQEYYATRRKLYREYPLIFNNHLYSDFNSGLNALYNTYPVKEVHRFGPNSYIVKEFTTAEGKAAYKNFIQRFNQRSHDLYNSPIYKQQMQEYKKALMNAFRVRNEAIQKLYSQYHDQLVVQSPQKINS